MPTTSTDGVLAAADRHERRLASAVQRTLNDLQQRLDVAEVTAIIDAGRAWAIPQLIPWNDLFTLPTFKSDAALSGDELAAELLRTMIDAGRAAAVPGSSFTITNPYAVQAARTMAASMIRYERTTTQQAIRRVIVSAVRGNLTSREAAVVIARSVGLDARSAQALANYASQLAAVEAGNAGVGTLARQGFAAPKTARGRASAVDRYAKRLLKRRAETIARSEIMTAANRGALLSWEQAARDGLINVQHARRQFVVTWDDRLCERCAPLDGAVVPFGDPFEEDYKGEKVTHEYPPVHQMCRCCVILLT